MGARDANDSPARKPVVLVVEADDDCRRAMSACLRHLGFTARTAHDATHALAAFDEDCDAVVSDVDLSGCNRNDGLELVRALRARDADVPIVLMSGRPSDDIRSRLRPEDACDDVLEKPFTLDDIERVLVRARTTPRRRAIAE